MVEHLLRRQLAAFLEEDLGHGDLTSEALIPPSTTARATVVAREAGIAAGLREARVLADLVDLGVEVQHDDGAELAAGAPMLHLEGSARSILGIERTLLNLVGHMSGIATVTRRAVAAVDGTGVRIAATRKTLPGLRAFEKRAVAIGGGDPHRYDLAAAVLIKDNHLQMVDDIGAAVRRARRSVSFTVTVEVEAETAAVAVEAAAAGADIVMLDNMDPAAIREVAAALRDAGLRERITLEASGGIRPEDLPRYASTGIDVISIGALTASARSLDLSMEIAASTT